MSKTIVCLSAETLPFYTQDICKEKSYTFDSTISTDSVNKNKLDMKDNLNNSNLVPQDENKYSKQSSNSSDPVVLKQSLSKKREASNILVECVKRRENMQNMSFNCNVPFENNFSTLVHTQTISFQNNARTINDSQSGYFCDVSLSDLSSTADSGVDSSKSSSPSHSLDNISTIDVETCSNDMETDSSESIKCNSENVELSPKSAAISEDLDGLNLSESKQTEIDPNAKSPIIKSLFKDSASMLYFSTKDETVNPLPQETLSLMKWKLSTITPVLIREIILKCGFHLVEIESTEDWIGTWGKHLKCLTYRKIKSFQKVNHYPGGFHLGRKDKLWNSIRRMQTKHSREQFSFFPDTYILPADLKVLKKVWEEEPDRCWITKPCASARGTGVKVIHKWSQVPKTRPAVVQRYICDPYLINGSKFDLRVYVLVPSFNPLRIYVFEDGLVRFASEKYSLSNKSFGNRFIHLTNYSINRKSSAYTSNEDENLCQGHKWSLKSFWTYMADSGIDVEKIKTTIVDMIIKTVLSSEGPICRLMRTHTRTAYNCFELFGFDIMLDKDLQPWLLEVNITPSLHTKSTLDLNVKGSMVKDMLNIAGFEVPEKSEDSVCLPCKGNRHLPIARILSMEEKKKHNVFSSKHASVKNNILEGLTFDDLSCLMESEDEFNRRGSFTRVFPTYTSHKYFMYFSRLNYYNVLLDAWEQTFYNDRAKGIVFIQEMYDRLSKQQISETERISKQQIVETERISKQQIIETETNQQISETETKKDESEENCVLTAH